MLIKMNENFGGIMPAVDERKLPYNAAQTAQDVNLDGGTLAPYKGRTSVETGIGASQKSLYHYHRPLYTLTCGANGGLIGAYQAVTDGAFVIGDDQFAISGLDLSGAADFDAVAVIIQAAMREYDMGNMVASTCVYDADLTAFVFTYNERIPYLEEGYTISGDLTALGSNSIKSGGATVDNAFDGDPATLATFLNLGTVPYWIKKDFGANSDCRLSEVTFKPSSSLGFHYDSAAGPTYRIVAGVVTFEVSGSDDDITWQTIGRTSVSNSTATIPITINSEKFFRYLKFDISFEMDSNWTYQSVASIGYTMAEITITGNSYGEATDLSDSSYLNGENGTSAMVETDDTEWLTWSEEDISVVKSPVVEDRYSRIYWTGEDGKLKTRGTFGTRDVNIEKPDAPSITFTDVYAEAFTGQTEIVYAGPTTQNDAMTLVGVEKTDVGYSVTFNMPEIVIVSASTPTFKFQLKATGAFGGEWMDTGNIGTSTGVVDYGTVYAQVELTSVAGSTTASLSGTTYTWDEREVVFAINMNYWLQTNTTQYYLCTFVDDLGQEGEISFIDGGLVRNAEERATVRLPRPEADTIKNVRLYRSANSSVNDTTGWFFVTEQKTEVFTDAVEAGTTTTNVTATDHDAEVGMTFGMTSGGEAGELRFVTAIVDADNFTLETALSGTPTATETFELSWQNYVDWNRDEDLVEGLTLYDNPVSDMDGLVVMPGMFGLAFKDQTLYASEQELLYAWNPGYELNYDANIVALAIANNECYVITEDQLYLVTGDTPDNLTSIKITVNQSGLNWRGVTTVAGRVLYPSPDGYVAAVGGQANLITEEYIQARDWSNYAPSTLVAEQYNNKLYACSSNTFFIMDFDEGLKAISTLSYASTVLGLHYDSIDDKLYCIIGTGIWSIDTNATTYDNIIWRSKEFEELKPWRPSCVRVYADDYTTSPTLKLYAEGALVHTATITDDKGLKIPQLRKEKRWFFEIESKYEILDVELADSIGNLK